MRPTSQTRRRQSPNFSAYIVSRISRQFTRSGLGKMINLTQHPFVLLLVAVCSFPIYRGLALAVFGNSEAVAAVVKHLKTPDTWNLFKDSGAEEDVSLNVRLFAFALLCIGFVTATYDLLVRYAIAN